MSTTPPPWVGVPLSVAATLLHGRPDLAELAAAHLHLLGARPEVDLAGLAGSAGAGPQLARALAEYGEQCTQLWRDLRDESPTGNYVLVRRPLLEQSQRTGKKDRADLVDLFAALEATPPLGAALAALTEPDPDLGALGALAAAHDGTVDAAPGALELTVPCTGALAWPALLGGPTWPGEVRRVVTLTARHAAWRDRRVRRLAKVSVAVDEVWPDPAEVAASLPGPQPAGAAH